MILMLFLDSESGPDGNASGIHNDRLRILSAFYLPCVNLFNPHNNPVRCMKKPRQRTTWVICSRSHSQEVADLGFELRTSGYSPPPSFTVLQYFTCHGAFCAGDIPTSLEFLSWCLIYLYGFPLTPFPCSHKTPSNSENRVPLMNHQDIDGHFRGFLWRSHFLILTQFTRMKQWLWHIIPACNEMNENLYPQLLVEKRDADHIFGTHHLYK